MPKESIDLKKVLSASFITIGAGIVLVIVAVILQLLSFVIQGEYGEIVDLLYIAYSVVLYPVFLVLYFWTGMRAAKNFGFDAVGAGGVAAFAYFVVGLVERLLNVLLAVIVVSRPLSSGGFGSADMVVASSLFGGIVGLSGVALAAVCGFGILLMGTMVNFVVGGFGALFALRKS